MNKSEAIKVVETLLTADGGCNHCSYYLIENFIIDFPKYRKLAIEMWEEEFEDDFEVFGKK